MVDSSVLLHGFGRDHHWRAACQRIIAAAAEGTVRINVSVECLQEFLLHRLRVTSRETALGDLSAIEAAAVVHDFDAQVWRRAVGLITTAPIRGRDAVHAATALEHGFTEIVTTDADFAVVPGLTPVAPDRIEL